MTTDFRALCVELTDCLEKADWPPSYKVVFQQWTDIARAALAEPDGPAVSDDRELASVAMQPSDEELNRLWFETDGRVVLGAKEYARAVLARWGTPNLTETRRSLTDAWAAHQPAIEAAAKAGMDACRSDGPAVPEGSEPASVAMQPSDEELLEKGPSLEEVEELCEEHCFNVEGCESLECLQGLINVALARWGRTAAAPVPVSERGRCSRD